MNKRAAGAREEERSAEYLSAAGYEILERNYRCRQGEIDLIARDGKMLVFVEVKYRKDARLGTPEDAVGITKQRRISRVALWYLAQQGCDVYTPCRFDVMAVTPEGIRHYPDAFPFRR